MSKQVNKRPAEDSSDSDSDCPKPDPRRKVVGGKEPRVKKLVAKKAKVESDSDSECSDPIDVVASKMLAAVKGAVAVNGAIPEVIRATLIEAMKEFEKKDDPNVRILALQEHQLSVAIAKVTARQVVDAADTAISAIDCWMRAIKAEKQ